MKNRNIIEFIHELGDGGASALVKDYALLLNKDGYDVTVVVVFPEVEAVTFRRILQAGIEIIPVFPKRNYINRIRNKIADKYFISRKLRQIINEKKPLAIHAHLAVLKYLEPLSKELKGINLFFTCHSIPAITFCGNNNDERVAAERLIKNSGLHIIALHEDMKNELDEIFQISNTIIIKNGIDFDRYKNLRMTKEEIRKELKIPFDAYVVGHVGRFSKVKNHDFIIKIFKRLRENNKKAFLLLVGTGELKNKVEETIINEGLVADTLILTHRNDIPEIMKAMDVLCVPSLYESFSLVTLEAQVVGIPCVVADTIPKQALLTKNITVLSLDAPEGNWAEKLNTPDHSYNYNGDINEYDINIEVKKLERLYEGS